MPDLTINLTDAQYKFLEDWATSQGYTSPKAALEGVVRNMAKNQARNVQVVSAIQKHMRGGGNSTSGGPSTVTTQFDIRNDRDL